MRALVTALVGTALVFSAAPAAPTADLSAPEILSKVAQTYRGLHGYQMEAVQKESMAVAGNMGTLEVHLSLAVQEPGKLRLAVNEPGLDLLVVSDGRTTWWYRSNKKIYTRVSAAATLSAGGEEEEGEADVATKMERNLVGRYARLEALASEAVLEREDHLKVGGEKVRCYVVELRQPDRTHELWIDAERFLVLRHKERGKSVGGGRTILTELQTDLKQVQVNTPPADLFSFTPPPKAREVQVLGIPGERVGLAGKTAEDFSLKDAQGERVRLGDLRGKVVLLDFWATWCPPCREELPRINALYRKLKDQGLVVFGVNDEDAGTIRSFLKKHAYELPTLVDSSQAVHKMYGIQAIPTLVIIDRQGLVVADYVGERTEEELAAALKTAGLSP